MSVRRASWAWAASVCVVALVLLAFGLTSFARRLGASEPVVGIEWAQAEAGPTAIQVDEGSPAAAAGVLPGDVLARIGGRPVKSSLDATRLGWETGARGTVSMELLRDGRRLDITLAPERRASAPLLYAYLGLVALAFLVSGTFIAARWPTVRGGRVYASLAAALFAMLTLSHTGQADALDWTIYWGDVAAGALAPALLVHLVIAISRRTLGARLLTLTCTYVASALVLLSGIWVVGLGGAHRFAVPALAVEAIDRLEMLLLAVAVFAAAIILARSYHRASSALHRSQVRWMLWGLVLGVVPFSLLYALPWSLGATVPSWADLSVLPLLLMPAAFTAALARYRLNDLDTLLRVGLSEVTAAFFTLAVYAASADLLRRASTRFLPLSPSGTRYFAILIAAVSYPQVRRWVRAALDRAVYRSRYSFRATLLDWARELNAETDLPRLLDHLEQRVRDTLGLSEARVLVRSGPQRFEVPGGVDEGKGLTLADRPIEELEQGRHVVLEDAQRGELSWARHLFGMKVKGRLCAVLASAERENPDEPLSSEDRALLATLAAHASTAIEAARLVREVRQHAEQVERLKASQERILESSGVGLLLLDADRRILAWNRTLEEIYGLPRAEALGKGIEEVFPLHAVRRIQRELAACPPGQEARIYRYNLVNRAGRRIIANVAISPTGPGPAGDGARVITFDDVTEQVKLEEQVLRQERLASLGLLAAGVAHEVNTPLTGISSYTQMLLEEMSPEDPRYEILGKIEAQSRRASSIANSLLNLARPDRASFEELSLNDAVREVITLFEPQVRRHGIRLESDLPSGIPPVRGHKAKLQQVLLNLLLNARDAVEGGGTITVATSSGEAGRVLLEVTDDGVGIAEEDLPRIFDPFFTTKGRGKGTGLGLSISYDIVREHDGDMHVDSQPGRYTRFRVDLPAVESARALA